MKIKFLLFAFAGIFCQPLYAQDSSQTFSVWLEEFQKEAIALGVSEKIIKDAFEDVDVLSEVVALDRKQPENKISIEEYLEKAVTNSRISNGKKLYDENKEILDKVSEKYSVPTSVIVALWGMETSYGENVGSFNIIASLTTLAYEGRRGEFFRGELINALKIMEAEKISVYDFDGSWAGAFGQCQFMPSSYLKYAVDFDGDGKRDIWYSLPDIFASIANYLHSEGWDKDGVIIEGSNNFKVLLKWNRSRYFATAVGKIAKSIGE